MSKKKSTCAFCGAHGILHVDKYHRLTPLCGDCYAHPATAKATASNPNDPESWWNNYIEENADAKT